MDEDKKQNSIFTEGQIIVCTHKNGMGGWINEGEIAVIGGKHYSEYQMKVGLAAKTVHDPDGNACSIKCDYRAATEAEARFYNRGGRNINDMKEELVSLKKEDLVKGEIYFYSKPQWDNDYVEYYDLNGTYPTIMSVKNKNSWSLYGVFYCSCYSVCPVGLFIRKATQFEKDELIRIMKDNDCVIPVNGSIANKPYNDIELVVGNWYEVKAFSHKSKYIVKYIGGWDNTEYLSSGTYCNGGSFDNVEVVREVMLSEIEGCLPKAQTREQYLIAEAKKRYSEGDRFKCLNNNRGGISDDIVSYSKFRYVKNWTSDIKEGIYHGNLWICIDNGMGEEWAGIIKSDKQAYSKFKVGDFISGKSFSGSESYEISKIEGDKFWIYFTPRKFEEWHNYRFSTYSDLEVVKKSKSWFDKQIHDHLTYIARIDPFETIPSEYPKKSEVELINIKKLPVTVAVNTESKIQLIKQKQLIKI